MNEDLAAFSQPQKLIRCLVSNERGETSIRLVELENFQLWRYMMHTKHKLKIAEEQLCVWVSDDEYRAKEELYSRSGRQVPVIRIVVLLFDAAASYCHTIQRYAPAADAGMLRDSLSSCVPEAFRAENRFEIHQLPGHCIDSHAHGAPAELILGLSTLKGGTA